MRIRVIREYHVALIESVIGNRTTLTMIDAKQPTLDGKTTNPCFFREQDALAYINQKDDSQRFVIVALPL